MTTFLAGSITGATLTEKYNQTFISNNCIRVFTSCLNTDLFYKFSNVSILSRMSFGVSIIAYIGFIAEVADYISPDLQITPLIKGYTSFLVNVANKVSSIALLVLGIYYKAPITTLVFSAITVILNYGEVIKNVKKIEVPTTVYQIPSFLTSLFQSSFSTKDLNINWSHLNIPVIALSNLNSLDHEVNLNEFSTLWDSLSPDHLPRAMYDENGTNVKPRFLNVVQNINNNNYRARNELTDGDSSAYVRLQKTKLQHILKSIKDLIRQGDSETAALAISNLAFAFNHCQTAVSEILDRTCRELTTGISASRDLTFEDQVVFLLHQERHSLIEHAVAQISGYRSEAIATCKRFKKQNQSEFGLYGQELSDNFVLSWDHLGMTSNVEKTSQLFYKKYTENRIIEVVYNSLKSVGSKSLSFPLAYDIFNKQLDLSTDPDEGYIEEDTYFFTRKGVEQLLIHLKILN